MIEAGCIKKCPVCESSSFKVHLSARDADGMFNAPFNLLRCDLCGFIFLGEVIKSDSLYTEAYYRNPKAFLGPLFDFALHIFILDRIKLIERYRKAPGKILDIGCGDGSFLMAIKEKGWDALGIDTSAAGRGYMADKKLPILKGNFLDADISPESMDAVTYWYSFEHLANPVEYLEKTYRTLKKGGILVISVQNIESLQALFSGDKWFHLDIPRHILHFSPSTLRKALLNSGFEILTIDHRSLQMNIFGWYQSLFNLLCCQPNFVYNLLKRGHIDSKRMPVSLLITLLGTPFILPASLMLSKIEEFCGRGGIINAIAKKRI